MKNQNDNFAKEGAADSIIYNEKIMPLTYQSLFKNREKVTLIGTTTSKTRDSIVEFYYDDKFYIHIYKIGIVNQPLSKFISEKQEDIHISYNQSYRGPGTGKPFEVNYKSGGPDIIDHVYFDIFGVDTHLVTNNDTVVSYYSSFKNLAVQYAMDRPQDIFFKSNTDAFIPINVSFVKKKNMLYFIFLSAKGENKVEPGTLNEILK